jgi:hypothetical protein
MTRPEEARERCMEALDAWWEQRAHGGPGAIELEYDLIDAYAALRRAQNGEPEDEC